MAALLGFTMVVAVYAHLIDGDSWLSASHALEMAFVFLSIMIIGPGKYSLDYWLTKKD
jgi:putative oxidoreductase